MEADIKGLKRVKPADSTAGQVDLAVKPDRVVIKVDKGAKADFKIAGPVVLAVAIRVDKVALVEVATKVDRVDIKIAAPADLEVRVALVDSIADPVVRVHLASG